MLNIEKYKEMLIDTEVINITKLAVINDKPVECRECYCSECDFGGKKDCKPYLEEWLFSEYEEPEVDWSKIKVDTPIYVRDKTSAPWVTAHFAKYEEGKVCSWFGGRTSFTSEAKDDYYSWKYAKLAESED
ncbi:hypothetical protein [Eubacterium sp.]|uniref:hypothetical protein n=1 Tax=Eubacterium sp. TaxID=142586 RepID=UPI001DB77441|nr:hypothetical protein [Eubacterium sp.]MBS5620442.1 hypothetical protein [Eubacterium sp.]